MNRYPNNQYSYERNDKFPSNRLYYGSQGQVRHPPGALHYQSNRSFGSTRPHQFALAEFGTVRNIRRNPNETVQLRPLSPSEQPWSHGRGQGRSMNEDNSQHRDRFSQQIGSNYNRTMTQNEVVNGNPIAPIPPVPQWANANVFQPNRSPSVPVPPPNIFPNAMHPYSTWGQQVLPHPHGPHGIAHNMAWTTTASYVDHDKNREYDFQESSNSDRIFVDKWLSRRNICKTVNENKQKTMKVLLSLC